MTKLIARGDGVQIKIEVTPVLRGCIYETELRTVSPRVEERFEFAEINLVSFADFYAGKIMNATISMSVCNNSGRPLGNAVATRRG